MTTLNLSAIYASKLYKASPRKDKIRAAIELGQNNELITQLATALDPEYRTAENLVSTPEDASVDTQPESEIEETDRDEDNEGFSSIADDKPSSSHSSPSHHSSLSDALDEGDELISVPSNDDELDSMKDDYSKAQESPEEPAEASTVIGSDVKASTDLVNKIDVEVVKDSLNLDETTSGVARVKAKDDEVWVYYTDDVNLNNIMTDVIEYVNSAWPNLEFNRLARSDNAIVFESLVSTREV